MQLLAAAVPGSCSVAYIYYKFFFLSLSSSAPFELCLLGRKIKVRNSPLGQKKNYIPHTFKRLDLAASSLSTIIHPPLRRSPVNSDLYFLYRIEKYIDDVTFI